MEAYEFVGGLVGWNGLGTIDASFATGKVMGPNEIGGLVGTNFSTICNSYAIADVEGYYIVGGLVGKNNNL